jgi:hypothetical protein
MTNSMVNCSSHIAITQISLKFYKSLACIDINESRFTLCFFVDVFGYDLVCVYCFVLCIHIIHFWNHFNNTTVLRSVFHEDIALPSFLSKFILVSCK